jgi:hypothetical protein
VRAFQELTRSAPTPEDIALYAGAEGPESRGYRLTILSATTSVAVGEAVRVVHVCESVSAAAELYVMGPKPVYEEYVDDIRATDRPPAGEDPFAPAAYDGRVLPGPGVDTNYEVMEYAFTSPGEHTVQWRLGEKGSNTLRFTVH